MLKSWSKRWLVKKSEYGYTYFEGKPTVSGSRFDMILRQKLEREKKPFSPRHLEVGVDSEMGSLKGGRFRVQEEKFGFVNVKCEMSIRHQVKMFRYMNSNERILPVFTVNPKYKEH